MGGRPRRADRRASDGWGHAAMLGGGPKRAFWPSITRPDDPRQPLGLAGRSRNCNRNRKIYNLRTVPFTGSPTFTVTEGPCFYVPFVCSFHICI